MPLSVTPVASEADLDLFLRLPVNLYRGLSGYVPPLMLDRRSLLDPKKSSFFKHGTAQYWIARRDGEPVGRISAQIDGIQPEGAFNGATALFGCVDAIDDPEVTAALFHTAETWLREKGHDKIAGPFALNMNAEPGLLVEGQEEPPLALVAWHPSYLLRHFVTSGFTPSRDLHYWRLPQSVARVPDLRAINRLKSQMPDIAVRRMSRRHARREVEIIRTIYNDAWKDNWGFVPLHPADVEVIIEDAKPFLREEYGIVVEKAGRPIAVALCFPNLFEVTRDLGTDPSPWGWAKLAYRSFFHRFESGFIIVFGVISEFRHTVGGAMIAMAMIDEMLRRGGQGRLVGDWLEAGWVLDNNVALQKILVQYGFHKARTLRLFEKHLSLA
ncbi:MAG: hypothetical protein ACTHOR_05035 [Devosia sp.]